jgi:glucose/arabinose dehydrogenase
MHFLVRATFCFLVLLLSTHFTWAQKIALDRVTEGFDMPLTLVHAGDERLFVVEKAGRIWQLQSNGQKASAPYLDISDRVNAKASERGLLGLAFHPDFAQNGYLYVNYTNADGHTCIARFKASAHLAVRVAPSTEQVLLTIKQPFSNHNAGDLAFGPDGYLYIGTGDGGSGGDPGNRSQNPLDFLGKMLRLDVDGGNPYAIPPDNPFAHSRDTLREIWALGLRNPWRISFDRETGDLWIADVGQNEWEEINREPAGSPGGLNWGWRCYEGFAPFKTAGCQPPQAYARPVHVYPNEPRTGCSVTGGYVYRGKANPDLTGKYIYTDFCSGIFWALEPSADQATFRNRVLLHNGPKGVAAFGEDVHGELYVVSLNEGAIYRIRQSSP